MDKKIEDNFNQKVLNSPFKNTFQIRFSTNKFNQFSLLLNQDIKFQVSYNFYGVFHPKLNVFFWGNMIPGINLNFKNKIKKIKEMKHLFEDFSQKNNEFYFQVLNEDSIILKDLTELDKIKKLILYLSGNMDIIMPVSSEGKFQIIGIEEILEKY